MADDTNQIMGGDEMDMENSLSQNRILSIKRGKKQYTNTIGRENSQSSLDNSVKNNHLTDVRVAEQKESIHQNILAVRNKISTHTRLTEKERSILGKMTTNESDEELSV